MIDVHLPTTDGREVLLTRYLEPLGLDVAAFQISVDLIDTENKWQAKTGAAPDGALLLRPDGFVAWRSRAVTADPGATLVQVLSKVLCKA